MPVGPAVEADHASTALEIRIQDALEDLSMSSGPTLGIVEQRIRDRTAFTQAELDAMAQQLEDYEELECLWEALRETNGVPSSWVVLDTSRTPFTVNDARTSTLASLFSIVEYRALYRQLHNISWVILTHIVSHPRRYVFKHDSLKNLTLVSYSISTSEH